MPNYTSTSLADTPFALSPIKEYQLNQDMVTQTPLICKLYFTRSW